MADTPTKPLDRLKPFKRINNDKFLVKNAPDGFGVDCGCHTPDDLGDVQDEFLKFLDDHLPVPIIKVLQTVEEIAKEIGSIANQAKVVAALLGPLALLLGLGGGVAGLLALIGTIAAIADGVSSIVETTVGIIKDAVKKFFESIGKKILQRALRVIPQWMPVKKDASNAQVQAEQLIEMEGIATRSFGNPIDVPFFQWHRWFDWNIQVAPEPDYAKAVSPAGDPPNTTGFQGGETPITKSGSFEIQIDPGIMWNPEKQVPFETGFGESAIEAVDAPMVQPEADWCWPQTGMFVWAAGRWVYDCSRVTTDTKPKMPSLINPAKAIASARWKATRLSGQAHGLSVPVIQFMFFATTKGGYIDFDPLDHENYEFIVDLPPAPDQEIEFPIAHTGKIPHNTIVIRPRLLINVSRLSTTDTDLVQPVVEPILGDDPTKPFQQVKVTVPLKDFKGRAAGFVLSMGWFDPNFEQAASVKECTLTLDKFSGRQQIRDNGVKTLRDTFAEEEKELRKQILDRIDNLELPLPDVLKKFGVHPKVKDLGPLKDFLHSIVNGAIDGLFAAIQGGADEKEEWLMRFGLNGVWLNCYDNTVDSKPAPLKHPIAFPLVRLGPDDLLSLSVHGTEFDPVGDMMRAPHRNRILTENSVEVPWNDLCKPATGDAAKKRRRDLVFQYVLKVMSDTTGGKLSLGLDDHPLGMIDPDISQPGTSVQNSNPLTMKGIAEGVFPIRRTAKFARAVGDQSILAEDPSKVDYFVEGSLTINKQKLS